MKLLAILRDSLRESIDTRVFHVMLALSLLLAAAGATMTFTPQPGGKSTMALCAAPLGRDLSKIDLLQTGGDPIGVLMHLRGGYQTHSVEPVDGTPDLPDSTFRVVVSRQEGFLGFGGGKVLNLDEVREQFGQIEDVRVAEVLSAEEAPKGKFVLHVRLTADGRKWWPHSFSLFFGALPLGPPDVPLGWLLYGWQNYLVNMVGAWIALLVSLVMTAFFIPNMLRKGTVDLLLVKPISRPALLLYKYVGGLLFIAINTIVAVGGFWLALSLRSGLWVPGALASIPAITFFFAILYSVSVLYGVMTRSAIVAILMSCLVWTLLFAVGTTVGVLDALAYQAKMAKMPDRAGMLGGIDGVGKKRRRGPPPLVSADYEEGTFGRVVRAIHFVLPRTNDLNALVTERLQRDLLAMPRTVRQAFRPEPVNVGESAGVSLAFIGVMLGLACWWFSTKDY